MSAPFKGSMILTPNICSFLCFVTSVKARNANTGKPLKSDGWRSAARHPVHIPGLFPIEICVEDLLRHWPEQSGSEQKIEHHPDQSVVHSLVLANTALSETVAVLQKAASFDRTGPSIRESAENAFALYEEATACPEQLVLLTI
jgi:hypothetical protein